jgi:hypothetical protein
MRAGRNTPEPLPIVPLAKCEKIDECKDWADKAAALASYAKQSKDESLSKLAIRIQARAIRRCGELLKEFEAKSGERTDLEPSTGNGTRSETRKSAADKAGLSKRQKDTAIRVANVPQEEFEAQLESDSPPTVTALAEQGTHKKPLHDLEGIDPYLFKLATRALALADNFSKFVETVQPQDVWQGLKDYERSAFFANLRVIGDWIDSAKQISEKKD